MTDWLPSLNALRAFEAASRHLNYRLAAEELSVSPAAVKQLVAKLEQAVGAPLLRRKGRGLALTAAGEAGRSDLFQAFAQIAGAVGKMRAGNRRRRLIVSVEPSFATAWLVPRLDRFRQANPDVDVLIDSSLQIVDLAGGRADIAVRFGGQRDPRLVTHRLFDEQLCALCSPTLAAEGAGLARLEDLERVTLLHWDLSQAQWAASTRRWMEWTRWLAHAGAGHVVPGEGLRFTDYNLAVQAAIAGQGVVLASWPILRDLIEAKLLVSPFAERVDTDIGYDLVTTERALARGEVRSFLDWIVAEAEA